MIFRWNSKITLCCFAFTTRKSNSRLKWYLEGFENVLNFILKSTTTALAGNCSPASQLISFDKNVLSLPFFSQMLLDEVRQTQRVHNRRHLLRVLLSQTT